MCPLSRGSLKNKSGVLVSMRNNDKEDPQMGAPNNFYEIRYKLVNYSISLADTAEYNTI